MADKTQLLGVFLVRRVGLRKAVQVATFVVAWGIYSEKSPGPHDMKGYTAYWRQSLATSYKERDTFRMAFPSQTDPSELWSQIRAVYRAKLDDKRRDVGVAEVFGVSGSWS
jgi:hypothetical protein